MEYIVAGGGVLVNKQCVHREVSGVLLAEYTGCSLSSAPSTNGR